MNGRGLAVVALALAGALGAAGGAGAGSAPPRFAFFPEHAYQGKPASIVVLAQRSGVDCTLAVTYANGAKQDGLGNSVATAIGRAQWTWKLPLTAR